MSAAGYSKPYQRNLTMPFKKVGPNRYKSPSGRKWTKKQVIAYHASDGFTKKRRKKK